MKTVRRKTIMLVIAVALVLSISIGTAFAYFSDRTEATGEASLTLGSKTDIEETVTDNQKTISIKNTGETDVLVRVGIYGPDTMTVDQISGTDWEYDETTGFWYYTKVLPAPQGSQESATSNIIAQVTAPSGQASNFDIVVVQESAQVTYDENGKVKVPEGWANKIK